MMNDKIIILGLPRSGTTIVTNYLHSQPYIFLFSEPHWQYKRFRNKKFFQDKKLQNVSYGWYNFFSKTPLLNSLKKINKHYKYVGFKETYRSDVYNQYNKKLFNETLIDAYVRGGYQILYVLRNPVDIWNSMMRFNTDNTDSWGRDLEAFIKNCDRLFSAAQERTFIIYENFVDAPLKTLIDCGFDPDVFTTDTIKPRNHAIGDDQANTSSKIERIVNPTIISKDDVKAIEESLAYEIFVKLKKEIEE